LKIAKFGYHDLAKPFRQALQPVFTANGVTVG
jgi:hypothetical protein